MQKFSLILFSLLAATILLFGCANGITGGATKSLAAIQEEPNLKEATDDNPDIEQAPTDVVGIGPAVKRADLVVSQISQTGSTIIGETASFDVWIRNIGSGTYNGGVGVNCILTKPNTQQITLPSTPQTRNITPNQEIFIRTCSFLLDQAGQYSLKGTVNAQVSQPTANDSTTITFSPVYNSCGNGICEADLNENVFTCPQDCNVVPQQITLRDSRSYPYDANLVDYIPWLVNFRFDANGNNITKISIKNNARQWRDNYPTPHVSPPLYVPTQALTQDGNVGEDTAYFLDNIDQTYPGYQFFNFEYNGFETNEQVTFNSFATNYFNYNDQNNQFHQIPFYIQLNKIGNSTFFFDGLTKYYQSTNLNTTVDGNTYDGNVWFASVPNSTPAQRFPTASNGVHTMYYRNGSVESNPLTIGMPGRNGLIVYYRLYADNTDTGDLYLVLSNQTTFMSKFGANFIFVGTDKTEDGTIDAGYYAPNTTDFNGGITNQFYIARFAVETGGNYTEGADIFADYDTKVFIDTSTHLLPTFPNNNLSFYTSAVEYNFNNQDGVVKFNLGNDGNNLEKAYNDYGTRFELLPSFFTILVPDHAKHGVLSVNKTPTEFKVFTTSETAGTNDFNSFFSAKKEIPAVELTQSTFPSLIDIQTTIQLDGVTFNRTFKEKIGAKFDMYFDYTSSTNPNDLEGQITTGDMNYTTDLGTGIPKNFVDGADDNIVVPFFGEFWKVVSTNCTQACIVVLEHT